jgi:hypothetical protein
MPLPENPDINVDQLKAVSDLKGELRLLQSRFEDQSRFERWIKILGGLGAIFVFCNGIYQYNRTAHEATDQQSKTASQEFRKRFWEEQVKVYDEASSSASEIAMSDRVDSPEAGKWRHEFWTLYWGRLSILENLEVKTAMVKYGEELSLIENQMKQHPGNLKQLSYALARACRRSLKVTWEPVPVDDIPDISITTKEQAGQR